MDAGRRNFLATIASGAAAALLARNAVGQASAGDRRPNIVWIIADDFSPTLSCYGDKTVDTPHIDALAAGGAVYTRCFNHAPVCSPARSGLSTGMYPTSFGGHAHRSMVAARQQVFGKPLRDAGYYVAWGRNGKGGKNAAKNDFNFVPNDGWADAPVDWVEQAPRTPFFGYCTAFDTHEGEIRDQPGDPRLAARLKLPPYLQDSPAMRGHMARYYERVKSVDDRVGEVIDGLKKQGVLDQTVVFFFADNGWAMPRGKRWLYDTGIRSPLIVHWPKGIKGGTVNNDLVALLDITATTLALAGAEIPKAMHGRPFLGERAAKPREYVFAARDRTDAVIDRCRAVRDKRYKYIRNAYPDRPYMQADPYLDQGLSVQELRKLAAEGKLAGPAKAFMAATKPREELYDVEADPYEVENLADKPEHRQTLARLSAALDQWIKDTGDMGAFSDAELERRGVVRVRK